VLFRSVFGMFLVVLAVLVSCVAAAPAEVLVWSDEFNSLNFSNWKHEITMSGGGNWEFEYYANNRSNSFVKDSILYLRPTLTADTIGAQNVVNGYDFNLWGSQPADVCTSNAFYGCERQSGAGGNYINPVQSARIRTAESFSFQYGRVEINAKLPKGDWMWPAMWMLPKHQAYGIWPASGEIDIVESRGNARGYPGGGVESFSSTLHWGPYYPDDGYASTHASYTLPQGDLSDDFHIYGLYWNSTTLFTYIDDPSQVVLSVDMSSESFFQRGGWNNSATINNPWEGGGMNAPFDQEFYLVLNVAVGGTNAYFPDGVAGKPWSNTDPHAVNSFWNAYAGQWGPTWNQNASSLQVDYIRVYQTIP